MTIEPELLLLNPPYRIIVPFYIVFDVRDLSWIACWSVVTNGWEHLLLLDLFAIKNCMEYSIPVTNGILALTKDLKRRTSIFQGLLSLANRSALVLEGESPQRWAWLIISTDRWFIYAVIGRDFAILWLGQIVWRRRTRLNHLGNSSFGHLFRKFIPVLRSIELLNVFNSSIDNL